MGGVVRHVINHKCVNVVPHPYEAHRRNSYGDRIFDYGAGTIYECSCGKYYELKRGIFFRHWKLMKNYNGSNK